jgi:hypothetical protein
MPVNCSWTKDLENRTFEVARKCFDKVRSKDGITTYSLIAEIQTLFNKA